MYGAQHRSATDNRLFDPSMDRHLSRRLESIPDTSLRDRRGFRVLAIRRRRVLGLYSDARSCCVGRAARRAASRFHLLDNRSVFDPAAWLRHAPTRLDASRPGCAQADFPADGGLRASSVRACWAVPRLVAARLCPGRSS